MSDCRRFCAIPLGDPPHDLRCFGIGWKEASIASSETVISTGVLNNVVVLKKESTPSIVASRNGVATTPLSTCSKGCTVTRIRIVANFLRLFSNWSRRSDQSAGADELSDGRATGLD